MSTMEQFGWLTGGYTEEQCEDFVLATLYQYWHAHNNRMRYFKENLPLSGYFAEFTQIDDLPDATCNQDSGFEEGDKHLVVEFEFVKDNHWFEALGLMGGHKIDEICEMKQEVRTRQCGYGVRWFKWFN